ncbi:MAG: response regulator [Planctomycetota bacterium]
MATPTTQPTTAPSVDDNHRLMLVDDDEIFRRRLAKAMDARGFDVCQAGDADEAVKVAQAQHPHYALLDQRMPGKSGLELIGDLAALDPDMQIVVLTGYGSIAHAVEATRAGAIDYLTKPVDADQIVAAFERSRDVDKAARLAADETTPSLARVEWDYMHRILHDCGGNISQAARKLGIHRRSLQRKLAKYPPVD